MTLRKCFKRAWLVLSILFLTVTVSLCVQAEPSVTGATYVNLKAGKEYKNYDLDGDGKKDTFRYDYDGASAGPMSGRSNKYATLTLNGKSSRIYPHDNAFYETAEQFFWCAISLYQYSRKNTFLITQTESTLDLCISESMVYQYRQGKPRKVLIPINHGRCWLTKIKGKDLYFSTVWSSLAGSNYADLLLAHTYRFQYRLNTATGKIACASHCGTCIHPRVLVYCGRTRHLSSSEKNINRKGMTLKKGRHYIVTKVYINPRNGEYLYCLKRRNEYGWINSDMIRQERVSTGRYPFKEYDSF